MSASEQYSEELGSSEPQTSRHLSEAPQPFSLGVFSQLLIFHNPASRRAEETPSILSELQWNQTNHGLDVSKPEKTSPHLGENIDMVRGTVAPHTIIGIRAGDGGTSQMLAAIRAAKLDNPVFLLPGGTKNDIWSNAFARKYEGAPTAALLNATRRLARPILAEVTTDKGSRLFDAYGYASTGVSSQVAAHMNSQAYRSSRIHRMPGGTFAAERLITARDFLRGAAFTASQDGSNPTHYVDIIASNANRMAGQLHLPSDLFEPSFQLITPRNKLAGLVMTAAMLSNRNIGKSVDAGSSVTVDILPADGQYLQVDGEEHPLTGLTTLHLSQAPTGVNVLTAH